jgi:hypothetical protein
MKRPAREPGRDRRPPTGGRRGGDATPFVIVLALGLFAFAAVGLFAVVPSIVDDVDVDLDFDTFNSPSEPTDAPAVTRTAAPPTASPSPTPGLPDVNGSPLSLSALETAWKAKGLTLFSGGGAGGFTGMAVTPAAVTAQRGEDSAELAVLVYPNSNVTKQDWNLPTGSAPSPTDGRSAPAGESIWWNQNVVVILISGSGSIGNDAREAFLGL